MGLCSFVSARWVHLGKLSTRRPPQRALYTVQILTTLESPNWPSMQCWRQPFSFHSILSLVAADAIKPNTPQSLQGSECHLGLPIRVHKIWQASARQRPCFSCFFWLELLKQYFIFLAVLAEVQGRHSLVCGWQEAGCRTPLCCCTCRTGMALYQWFWQQLPDTWNTQRWWTNSQHVGRAVSQFSTSWV